MTARLYREAPPQWQMRDNLLPRLIPGEWETVCTTLPQMQQFTESIEQNTAKPEKDLHFIMIDDLLPPLLDAEKKKVQVTGRETGERADIGENV